MNTLRCGDGGRHKDDESATVHQKPTIPLPDSPNAPPPHPIICRPVLLPDLDHAPHRRAIYQEEGLKALWKGATPFATHLALKYCLRWGSATYFKNLLRDERGGLTAPRVFSAGAMAGGVNACV